LAGKGAISCVEGIFEHAGDLLEGRLEVRGGGGLGENVNLLGFDHGKDVFEDGIGGRD